jgi:hypothetical protein
LDMPWRGNIWYQWWRRWWERVWEELTKYWGSYKFKKASATNTRNRKSYGWCISSHRRINSSSCALEENGIINSSISLIFFSVFELLAYYFLGWWFTSIVWQLYYKNYLIAYFSLSLVYCLSLLLVSAFGKSIKCTEPFL